jgi:hypothetical protein
LNVGQSHRMSAIESTVSVTLGYLMNVLIQFLIYPLFGIEVAIEQAFIISIFITVIAFAKNYGVRRLFNLLHIKYYQRGSKGVQSA